MDTFQMVFVIARRVAGAREKPCKSGSCKKLRSSIGRGFRTKCRRWLTGKSFGLEGRRTRKSDKRHNGPMDRPPLRVFIADDSPPVAEMLTELIRSPGKVDVIGVGDTEAGTIESIRAMKPDVVVLDLQLKTGSGTNVIRAVRANAELAHVRLVVTSNHVSPQMRAGCMQLGADDYFDKVKEIGALTARISELAQKRG